MAGSIPVIEVCTLMTGLLSVIKVQILMTGIEPVIEDTPMTGSIPVIEVFTSMTGSLLAIEARKTDGRGLIAARPKGVRTPIRTPKKNSVQPLHAASERRAEAARPSLQAARHSHAFNRLIWRATLPDRRAEPARLSGGRAKPARPSDRRAGFARLSAHVSLSIREAYVSRAIGATVNVAPIARLTNPPPSSTTQIRKQLTGHARQTLNVPDPTIKSP
ncbi:hypothetical protein PCASD_11295 [Puccinia coronata f. sp. avenae]|uniref:Uncharacterized protein n=1 Tax=Puccinia coronata f. sp. avenae TaxID=200324 RepID=A0A2N5UJ65_9BASI|nr:hypothetical protein PCASD_11295 [Puccinia coronata f. sp. avenae]